MDQDLDSLYQKLMKQQIWLRPTRCYTFSKDDFQLIVEPGVCDDWRVWQKWTWRDPRDRADNLRFEIAMGVDADGRFNVVCIVRVEKELDYVWRNTGWWSR